MNDGRLHELEGHRTYVRSVEFSADGRRALSGSGDGTMRLWDLEIGTCLRVMEGHTYHVQWVAWAADERRALSCGRDIRLWDVDTGGCLQMLDGHNAGVVSAAFSADHSRAFSCDWRGGIRVWDLAP